MSKSMNFSGDKVVVNPGDKVAFIKTIMSDSVAIVVNGVHQGFVTLEDAEKLRRVCF